MPQSTDECGRQEEENHQRQFRICRPTCKSHRPTASTARPHMAPMTTFDDVQLLSSASNFINRAQRKLLLAAPSTGTAFPLVPHPMSRTN
jgi:hypothetical protein